MSPGVSSIRGGIGNSNSIGNTSETKTVIPSTNPVCNGNGMDSDNESEDEGFSTIDLECSRGVDPFRFSQATLEDTQEDELNAILGELSALQLSLDREMKGGNTTNPPPLLSHKQINNQNNEGGGRTESPDNDSGFSDNASLLSSGSSLSASGSSSGGSTISTSQQIQRTTELGRDNNVSNDALPIHHRIHHPPIEDEKAAKIRVALAKMRAASVTRLYVKAFSPDGSSKALMVEESMTAGRVLSLLADKNHVPLSTKWTLVEHIPHLHMERIYEDHENLVENLLMWTRDSKNKIYFLEREDKYDMFQNPERYFIGHGQQGQCQTASGLSRIPVLDEDGKHALVDEFFRHGLAVPDVETFLYLKAEGKKAWKKFPFVLRASGIYYWPKGKPSSSKDLVCLTTIEKNIQVYEGVGWKKKFKSPTEFGLALKPARLQVKSHRHMKYLCAEDLDILKLWMSALRIAKHGKSLWENYRSLQEEMAHEDLDRFGRSVSLSSMPILSISTQNYHPPNRDDKRKFSNASEYAIPIIPSNNQFNNRFANNENSNPQRLVLTKNEESNSSTPKQQSVPSTIGPSPSTIQSIGTLTNREEGFESDSPVGGTIKRKPSTTVLSPKIPLTLNTRNLVSDLLKTNGSNKEGNSVTLAHTLQRKKSTSGSSSSSGSTLTSPASEIPPPNGGFTAAKPPPHPFSQRHHNQSTSSSTIADDDGIMMNSLEIANLPPPPPELLEFSGFDEVNVISSEHQINAEIESVPHIPPVYETPRPPSILKGSSSGGAASSNVNQSQYQQYHAQVNRQIPPPPFPPPPQPSPSLGTVKKGVTFASELASRINTSNRTNAINEASPKRLEEPPISFLTDLQRVMQKKWQVAQKCQLEPTTSPQEILGFRFDPMNVNGSRSTNSSYDEEQVSNEPMNPVALNNVRAWVSQHYGGGTNGDGRTISDQQSTRHVQGSAPIPPNKPRVSFSLPNESSPSSPSVSFPGEENLIRQTNSTVVIYENFQSKKMNAGNEIFQGNNMNTMGMNSSSSPYGGGSSPSAVALRSKKPPPPIPKRADSTHLSAHFVYN